MMYKLNSSNSGGPSVFTLYLCVFLSVSLSLSLWILGSLCL